MCSYSIIAAGNYPNTDDCDYDLWSSCGDMITSAMDGCADVDSDSFRSLCYFNGLSAGDISTCCPCIDKYAEEYDTWALLPCAV